MVAQVDAEDFYQYVARKEETIWRSFQDLDLDGTGEVDDEELLQALRCAPCRIGVCVCADIRYVSNVVVCTPVDGKRWPGGRGAGAQDGLICSRLQCPDRTAVGSAPWFYVAKASWRLVALPIWLQEAGDGEGAA